MSVRVLELVSRFFLGPDPVSDVLRLPQFLVEVTEILTDRSSHCSNRLWKVLAVTTTPELSSYHHLDTQLTNLFWPNDS